MELKKIAAVALAITLGVSTLASAQPRDRDDRGDGRGGPQGQMNRGGPDRGGYDRGGPGGRGYERHDMGNRGGPGDRGPGAGPDHHFYRGDRLPPEYRNRQYVVDDWRGHRLSAPPRGYNWVQVGGDYVLVAIATGVIASLLLNH